MYMDNTTVVSYTAIMLSLGTAILGVINHKRIRSNCFGRKVEVSLDIENTSPVKVQDEKAGAKK
jgi:hypothetical protein